MTDQLETEKSDGVLRITFRREDAFNALSDEMAIGLVEQLHAAVGDHEVRVVVITGSGLAFSAGADLTGDDPVAKFDQSTMDGAAAIIRAITELDKPVLAAVNGIAAGVGASICFASDLAICKESASFLLAFSQVGLMVDGGSSLTVAASVGRAKAMRMALLAEPLAAAEALAAGLVSHVVAEEEFDAVVGKVARRLAGGPPLAYAATKRAINAATIGDLEAGPGPGGPRTGDALRHRGRRRGDARLRPEASPHLHRQLRGPPRSRWPSGVSVVELVETPGQLLSGVVSTGARCASLLDQRAEARRSSSPAAHTSWAPASCISRRAACVVSGATPAHRWPSRRTAKPSRVASRAVARTQ